MPVRFAGRKLLLDIEGTTSSVRFVYDEMFPLVRRQLAEFLRQRWEQPEVQQASRQVMQDGQQELHSSDPHAPGADAARTQAAVCAEVQRQMDADWKATGLKQLQGLIWESAFRSGQLQAHLYDDVLPALRRWHAAGRTIQIYSSGSIHAQQLFFGHTIHGNLLPLLSGHFDTTIGSKKQTASYNRITQQLAMDASEILFVSDVVDELNAAAEAGIQTVLCCRPGNEPPGEPSRHAQITSFDEIQLVDP